MKHERARKVAPRPVAKKTKTIKKRNSKPSKHPEIAKFIELLAKRCVEFMARRDPKGKWDFSERSLNRIETFIQKQWGAVEKDGFGEMWQLLLGAYISHVFQSRYKLKWLKTKDFGWDLEVINDKGFGFSANPFHWVEKRVDGDKSDEISSKYKMIAAFADTAGMSLAERKGKAGGN